MPKDIHRKEVYPELTMTFSEEKKEAVSAGPRPSGPSDLADKLRTFVPELVDDLFKIFSVDKTIREMACDICSTVLKGMNERFAEDRIDFCTLFGYFDWLNTLKLKGAAGFQPYGFHWGLIQLDEGFVGRVAASKKPMFTNDLTSLKGSDVEKLFASLAPNVALLAFPLLLPNGFLVGVLVLGRFGFNPSSNEFFRQEALQAAVAELADRIATIYHHGIQVVKGKLSKKYVDNERHIATKAMQFYRNANHHMDARRFIELIASESMSILNAGNSQNPFYTNYLFYEYQEYRKRFVLRAFIKKPNYYVKNIYLHESIYKEFIEDGLVKSVECQKQFVQNRGKEPFVVRSIFNKVEKILENPDADWSPAGLGSAFIVPLFSDKKPLGILVFLSSKQNRQFVNRPLFYIGSERRRAGLYDLKYFRSLQPFLASEYVKIKLEKKQRLVAKLENILTALKEVIHIENQSEVLVKLAQFTAKSLDCEGCLIYLVNQNRTHLQLKAIAGFHNANGELTRDTSFQLDVSATTRRSLPVQILESRKEVLANSDEKFVSISGGFGQLSPMLRLLKGGKVFSYLGRPIGNVGVIEVFNKAVQNPSDWSSFEEQDSITLRHISEALSTVLHRMEATASRVQNEKVKVTSELLLEISHELKNPLFTSLIFVRNLKESLSSKAASVVESGELQKLAIIERNVEKAQRILRGMQEFQKIMTQMTMEVVNLEKIIRAVLETNQSCCAQQNIEMKTAFTVDEPFLLGDELRLNQVFTNLVTNAIDAMPDGGRLMVRLYETNNQLNVEVEDDGVGIPDSIKDRVFEAFVTTKNSDKGTGLGLNLCRQILSQHQGEIDFESTEGQGTTFTVILPKLASQQEGIAKLSGFEQVAS